jgi:hypothetical protein
MRTSLITIIILFVCSCEKDRSLDGPIPKLGWLIESLNSNYFIQFPINYIGSGFDNNCFFKTNPSQDIVISHCNCNDYWGFDCVGDTLNSPMPKTIRILPSLVSCSFVLLENKEFFYNNDSATKGLLYYTKSYKIDTIDINMNNGILFWNELDYFISLARFHFNEAKFDSVKMIIETIKKK